MNVYAKKYIYLIELKLEKKLLTSNMWILVLKIFISKLLGGSGPFEENSVKPLMSNPNIHAWEGDTPLFIYLSDIPE